MRRTERYAEGLPTLWRGRSPRISPTDHDAPANAGPHGASPRAERRNTVSTFHRVLTAATMVAFCAVSGNTADFRVTPYVQNPSTSAMTVMWLAQSNTTAQLKYWRQNGPTVTINSVSTLATALDYHASELNKSHFLPYSLPYLHKVRLTGLATGTRYDYIVNQDASAYTNRFKTAPPRDTPIRFIVYSDSETEPESTGKKDTRWHDPLNGKRRTYLIDQTDGYASNIVIMARREPDFFVIAGDLTQAGGEQRDWDEFWRHNAGELNDIAGSTPIVAGMGNHEYYGGTRGSYKQPASEQSAAKFLTYFDNPANGAGTAEQQERYFRLDYGPVTIIVLDTCNGDDSDASKDTSLPLVTANGCKAPDFNPGTAQNHWLESQLADAQSNSLFTFVAYHHVPFSVGYHGKPSGSGKDHDNLSGVPTRVLTNLFLKYGVDALFCGHDEMYERSQVPGHEIKPDGTTNEYRLHVYDIGIGGDGLRGVCFGTNKYEVYRAHIDSPEDYDASGILTDGGKHYGHLEINIDTNTTGRWEARFTPVYMFVYTNSSGNVLGFDRRVYPDEVTIQNSP